MNYEYRSLPCTDSPNGYAITGRDMHLKSAGILEWCCDYEDAKNCLREMCKFPTQFKNLKIEQIPSPNASEHPKGCNAESTPAEANMKTQACETCNGKGTIAYSGYAGRIVNTTCHVCSGKQVVPVPTPTLGLGDIVSLPGHGATYNHATVCQVYPDGTVDLFRPYTHTANFSYTGGVICYVGIENVSRVNPASLTLIQKGQPLK